ncbi:MAG: hypothetical protein IKE30_03390 [Clostridia bacterium]|nr:hypothetical protein [Clostridia bacterium]
MARSRTENVALGSTMGLILKFATYILQFAVKTIFIKTLGDNYNGTAGLFTDILAMMELAELGLSAAIAYALYKPIREKDNQRIADLMGLYRKAYLVIAGVLMIAGFALMPFLPRLVRNVPDIKESIYVIFFLYVLRTSSSYLLAYKQTLLSANQQRYYILRIQLLCTVVRSVTECAVLLIFRSFYLYISVGIAYSLVSNWIISRKADKKFPEVKKLKPQRLDDESRKALYRDVGALSIYRINATILSSTDSIIISAASSFGVATIGYLSNYRHIISTVQAVINQFFFSLTPSLGNLAVEKDADKQYHVFRILFFMTFWVLCFCSVSLITLLTPFIRDIWLREAHYAMPFSIPAILVFDFYIGAFMRPMNSFRNANGLFVQGRWRPAAMAVLNVFLSLALLKPLGIFGVLAATSISRIATQMWYDPYLIYREVFHRPVKDYWKLYFSYSCVTLLCIAATLLLSEAADAQIGEKLPAFLVRILFCAVIPNSVIVLIFRRSPVYQECLARLKPYTGRLRRVFRRKKP